MSRLRGASESLKELFHAKGAFSSFKARQVRLSVVVPRTPIKLIIWHVKLVRLRAIHPV